MKPIEELDLSVSSYNRLKMAGIDTVEQLQNMDECQLLRLRHMTQRNVDEITQKVRLCAVTNADHIRSMTDEELAEYLWVETDKTFNYCDVCKHYRLTAPHCAVRSQGRECIKARVDWLKQPYKEGS